MRRQHTPHIFSTIQPDGSYLIENTKTGEKFTSNDVASIAAYIRGHSRNPEHYAIGTAIHNALEKVGITGCLPCAERQAMLDSLIPRAKK